MSLGDYTITAGAGTKTLEGWGVTSARRRVINSGRDTLTLNFSAASILDDDIFTDDSLITVQKAGLPNFTGRVLPRTEGAAGLHPQITLCGGWLELERRQYCQPWVRGFTTQLVTAIETKGAIAGLIKAGYTAGFGNSVPYGRVYLCADPATFNSDSPDASRISTGAQIEAVVQWAIDRGAPLQIGTIAAGRPAQVESAQDITCAQAIQRMLRWTPGGVLWFDYATTPPTVNFGESADLSGVVVNAGSFLQDDSFRIGRASDTQCKGIIVSYKMQLIPADATTLKLKGRNGSVVELPKADLDLPDAVTSDFVSFEYPEGVQAGDDGVALLSLEDGDWPADGAALAQALYEDAAALAWRMGGTLAADDVPGFAGMGKRLNVSGGRPEWLGMDAPIQRCEDDLGRGRRTLLCGPAGHLTSADLAAQLLANRNRVRPADDQRKQQGVGSSSTSWGMGQEESGSGTGTAAGGGIPGAPTGSAWQSLSLVSATEGTKLVKWYGKIEAPPDGVKNYQPIDPKIAICSDEGRKTFITLVADLETTAD